MKLSRHILDTGGILRHMLLTTVVSKSNPGDYHGIGLLELIWKLIEWVLDEQMSGLEMHNYLHGFWPNRG